MDSNYSGLFNKEGNLGGQCQEIYTVTYAFCVAAVIRQLVVGIG